MPAAGAVLILAVVLIVGALACYLIPTIVALIKIRQEVSTRRSRGSEG